MGLTETRDLLLLEESDLQQGLSKMLQRKVLLIVQFLNQGGNLVDVQNLFEIKQAVENSSATTARPTTAQAVVVSPIKQKSEEALQQVIQLNVGGYRFTTTQKTLCSVPGSMLEAMFSGRHDNSALCLADGTYVSDRNGSQFSYLLDFLRMGAITSLPQSKKDREMLAVEADYYGLEALVRAIQTPYTNLTDHLNEDIVEIWRCEEQIRAAYKRRGELDSHVGLVSLFDGTEELPLRHEPVPAQKSDCNKVFMDLRTLSQGQAVSVSSLQQFRTNFSREHANVLNRLSLILVEEPVIIAGGSVLRALTVGEGLRPSHWWKSGKSDVDLFVHAQNTEAATRIARRIFYALALDNERWVILRSAGTITMHRWHGTDSRIIRVEQKVQIVLRMYDSPAEVLYGFDVDCCGCAFDGRQVWVTPRCLRAIRTSVNTLNPLHASHRKAYEIRLAKYAHRGFGLMIAGLEESRVDSERIRANALDSHKGLARLLKIAYAMERDVDASIIKGPLYRSDLKTEVIDSMSPCEKLINGRESYDGNDFRGILVPSVFCHGDPSGLHWYDYLADTSDFPLASAIRDEAWACIEDSSNDDDTEENDLPIRLVDAWQNDKRTREYINAEVDKIDLDTLYYNHAYMTKQLSSS